MTEQEHHYRTGNVPTAVDTGAHQRSDPQGQARQARQASKQNCDNSNRHTQLLLQGFSALVC